MIFGSGDTGDSGGYQIANSLRCRSSASAYMSRTPASAGNRKTFTISQWVKRGTLGAYNYFLSLNQSAGVRATAGFDNTGKLTFQGNSSGSAWDTTLTSNAVYRDPSAWYHIVFSVDTTQPTAANRVRMYVNGVEVTSFSAATYPAQNTDMPYNSALPHSFGSWSTGGYYFDGYLSEAHFVDGQALDPSNFAAANTDGVWTPKAYTGTYGTNGFKLDFSNGSSLTTLGNDASGNGNNWTATNISLTAGATYDWMVDTPTNNYAVLNPLATGANATLSSSNLSWAAAQMSGGQHSAPASITMSSGKWYMEMTPSGGEANGVISGIFPAASNPALSGYPGAIANSYGYIGFNGNKYTNGSASAYGATYTAGDVIGVAFDADNGTLTYYKNGASQGVAFASIPSGEYVFAVGNNSSLNVLQASLNFGQRPFTYTPPTGFKALNTANLPAAAITKAKNHFDVITDTGANIKAAVEALYSDQALMVVKDRANANNWQWFNDVTGLNAILQSNTTSAETTYSTTSGSSVGYGWKAGGAAVTNNAGSITSQVSANTTAGFSIVTYTGNGSNPATIGHGLGSALRFIILKRRDSAVNWFVYAGAVGNGALEGLNTTAAYNNGLTVFNNAAPTSTVFSIGSTDGNTNGAIYVAYCFAEVAGFSKFGRYTGNQSADGPFVFCGFRPKFVMWKNASAVSNWAMEDTSRSAYNQMQDYLLPNLSAAEGNASTVSFDFTANGFTVRGTDSGLNGSGNTIIFAAFAENPFGGSNVAPATAR